MALDDTGVGGAGKASAQKGAKAGFRGHVTWPPQSRRFPASFALSQSAAATEGGFFYYQESCADDFLIACSVSRSVTLKRLGPAAHQRVQQSQ